MRKGILIAIIAIPLVFFFLFASWGLQDFKIQESRIFTYLDTDADEVIDLFDNCPNTINPNQEDLDADNLGDACDFDSDNDGIVNAIDAFPQNPEEWDDFDFDGIGANEDDDDDNDGILDINDISPSPVSTQLSLNNLDVIENCAVMDRGFAHQLCYRDFFVSLVEEGTSVADVMDIAYFFAKLDAIDDCHFTAHHLGFAAFQVNPNLTENIMNTPQTCRNGFYHGLLSAFFDDLKNKGEDISNWHIVACDDFIDTEKFQHCVHGIGHGLIFYYDNDLEASVDGCHQVLDKISYESYGKCMAGVMMQYTDNELTESTSFEEVIPEICSKVKLSDKETMWCYGQLGRVLAFKTNHSQIMGEMYCNMLEKIQDKLVCVIGVSKEIRESEAFSS